MKILHICLACFYKKNFGYQENILPRVHKELGHQVLILAPAEEMYKDNKFNLISEDYINEDGIPVKIISIKKSSNCLLNKVYKAVRVFDNFTNKIYEFKPDVIFIHGGQSYSLNLILDYVKESQNVRLYIDQHGDYYNMPIKTLGSYLMKFTCQYNFKKALPYCNKFWGTTPWRCQYLHDIYNVPMNKIDLLVMGGDDSKIHLNKKNIIRKNIREQLNISEEDFIIISGGKIDKTKNIHLLMQAVNEINDKKLKLIVFGNADNEMKPIINSLSREKSIRYIGWIAPDDVYDYYLAADLAIFPGTHSVLWEQACACGLPAIFKDWEGMHHVDVGGNCEFIKDVTVSNLKNKIIEIHNNKEKFNSMKKIAINEGVSTFSYREIGRRAIED